MPLFLRPVSLMLVFVGGAAGTLLRELVQFWIAPSGHIPIGTLAVNTVGALLLGLLLESLTRRGADAGAWQRTRLLLGTGLLGGFTTYSALAEATAVLLREGAAWEALVYAAGTLVLGGLATWFGVALGSRLGPRGDGSPIAEAGADA